MNDAFATVETEVGHAIARAAGASGRPLLTQAMFWDSAPARALREGGVPVYRDIEAVVDTLARLVRRHEERAHGVPDVGTPAPPITGDGYFESRELLADGGVAFSPARRATSVDEARAAAADLGYPVVIKALGLLHKSDAGGVALGLADDAAVAAAAADMRRRAGADRLLGRDDGRHREAASSSSSALAATHASARSSSSGSAASMPSCSHDVRLALAPAGADELEELLLALRGAGVLTGARGRAPVDVRAAAEAAAALSRVAAAHPEIAELEINPLLVTPAGAVGLDARIVLAS